MTHPRPPPTPDVKFGKLSSPKFSGITLSSSGMKFSLVNIEGRPPETTSSAKVFLMPKKLPSLFSTQRGNELAIRLGFTNPPVEKSPTEFHFEDPKDPLLTLDLNTTTLNFRYKYGYENKDDLFSSTPTISKENAVSQVQQFIQEKKLFDPSILSGKVTAQYETYDSGPGIFRQPDSISQANSVRIDYRRAPIETFPVVSPVFFNSFNYAIYGQNPKRQILDISYTFWPIAFDNFGTYPLKTADAAWQDLLDGYAPIVNLGENKPDTIIIRKIYLGYYDSEEPQLYLQPIFIFEGDNNFIAYVPAVAAEWLE